MTRAIVSGAAVDLAPDRAAHPARPARVGGAGA
jgi:hypothetical protein